MHFAAAKSMKRKQEHFRCSQYKSGRGECAMHYIRDIVLERLVLEAVSNLSNFVRCYEPCIPVSAGKEKQRHAAERIQTAPAGG